MKINKETDTTETSFRCDCVETGFMGPQCQYPTSTGNINDDNTYEDPPTSNDGSEFFDCRLKCLNVSSKFNNSARSRIRCSKRKRKRERCRT
jgi:hypothetical protein